MTPAPARPDLTFEEARNKIVGWAECCFGEFNASREEDERARVELDAVLRAIQPAPVTDAGLREAQLAELLREAIEVVHQTESIRRHADPNDKTGWNIHGIETCADPLCVASLAALSRQAEKETA
jgi:hypothetical protein